MRKVLPFVLYLALWVTGLMLLDFRVADPREIVGWIFITSAAVALVWALMAKEA